MIRAWIVGVLLLAAAAGCNGGSVPGIEPVINDDAGADGPPAGIDGGTLASAPPAPIGLAVLDTAFDYSETGVSLVDATSGGLSRDDCLHSMGGSVSLTISTDVGLPSQPQLGNRLWLLDHGNVALTEVDPVACAILHQFSVAGGSTVMLNPHDLVVLSDAKAYVTRYDKDLAASNALGAGDDILIINPTSGALLGRIDLGPYAAPVAGATIQARPDRALLVGGKVYVSLGSQDKLFAATGEGRVAVVDPATDQVTGTITLIGFDNCSGMDYLAATHTLVVACGGAFSDADQLARSGLALVDLSVDPPAVTSVPASAFNGQPLNFSWVAALAPSRLLAGTFGVLEDPTHGIIGVPDAVFAIDPSSGSATSVVTAGAYNLGIAVGGGGRLWVPDATMDTPRVHLVDVPASGAPSESMSFAPDPSIGLLPRQIGWY
jgi:hypothetical protein